MKHMRRFKLKKIAEKIAKLEEIIMNTSDPLVKQKAENDMLQLTIKYNLNLVDMMEIDEMVQNMLQ